MTKKFRSLLGAVTAAIAILAMAPQAQAASIAIGVDNLWHDFTFGGQGSSWSDNFTFTLSAPAYLKVTDAFNSGDQFSVYNFAAFLGNTSVPTNGSDLGANYDAAFASALFSHASFLLGPGTYDISGFATLSPFGGGRAAVQLSSVPLPAALPLLAMGLAGLGGAGFMRKKKETAAAV
ncbi:MAG: hypothetical protein ABTQ34_05255 [Bdellovibrionales bacterium]